MDARRVLCCLVLLYVQLLAVMAGLEHTCTLSDFYENRRVHSRVSCSRRLPEMIKRLCRGAINIPGGFTIPHRRARDTAAGSGYDDSIFIDKMTASKYLSKRDVHSAGTQGIVCECCVHPCRRSELAQYCANRSRRSADVAAVVQGSYDDALVRKFYDDVGMPQEDEAAAPKRRGGRKRSRSAAASTGLPASPPAAAAAGSAPSGAEHRSL